MASEIEELLELYSLEEAFEVLDLDPADTIAFLIASGMCVLPPFLSRKEEDYDNREEQEPSDPTE